jgi:hypothetical protein
MPSTKSRVHPKYKTKYRVSNWSDYDRALVERGNLTIWLSPDAIACYPKTGSRSTSKSYIGHMNADDSTRWSTTSL